MELPKMKKLSVLLLSIMTVGAFAHQSSITSDVVPSADSAQARLVKLLSDKVRTETEQSVPADQRTVLVDKVENRVTYTVKDRRLGAAARSGVQLQCTEYSPGEGTTIQIQRYSCTFSAN